MASGVEAGDLVRKTNAQLRYYFHIDPESLNDIEWAGALRDLQWIREAEAKANKNV